MQYGLCTGLDGVAAAAAAGFNYFECSVAALLKPRESEQAFQETLAKVRTAPLPCPVVNMFIPGDLKITGPNVDSAALEDYVATTFGRAADAGVEIIVFGSGGARRVPDGFDAAEAGRQILTFCRMCASHAERHGVAMAIEPLNRAECNILNTVGECARLARQVNHPKVRVLVDGYHWAKDGDSAQDIVETGALLIHAHVATVANRMAPGAEECDLRPFFSALANAGYDGRISIEGKVPDPNRDLPRALALMRSLAE